MTNSAARLLDIIENAKQKSEKKTAAEVWAEVFGLNPDTVRKDPHQVQEKLHLMRKELDTVASLMQETSISAIRLNTHFSRLRSVISTTNLNSPWANSKNTLAPDTLLCLGFCADILKPEPEISREDLQGVLDQVQRLRQEIESTQISQAVRDFLHEQLNIIERAIQDYPIRGVVV